MRAPRVSDERIREAMKDAHSIGQAALELGMTERQLGTRARALNLPRRKPGGFKRAPLAPCLMSVEACSLPIQGPTDTCATLRDRRSTRQPKTTKHRSSLSAAKQDQGASTGADV